MLTEKAAFSFELLPPTTGGISPADPDAMTKRVLRSLLCMCNPFTFIQESSERNLRIAYWISMIYSAIVLAVALSGTVDACNDATDDAFSDRAHDQAGNACAFLAASDGIIVLYFIYEYWTRSVLYRTCYKNTFTLSLGCFALFAVETVLAILAIVLAGTDYSEETGSVQVALVLLAISYFLSSAVNLLYGAACVLFGEDRKFSYPAADDNNVNVDEIGVSRN